MEIYLLREAALPDVAAQRSKNQGSSQESGGTCERNEPRDVACPTALTPLPRLSQDCISASSVQVIGWRNRSGRTTGGTFAGRSGLASGDVYERESAGSVDTTEGRECQRS